MDATIIAAAITAISAIAVAIIGVIASRQKKKDEIKKDSNESATSDSSAAIKIDSPSNSKIIKTESITGGTIIQAERIGAVHLRGLPEDLHTGLRLVNVEIIETPPNFKVELGHTSQQSLVKMRDDVVLFSGRLTLDVKLRNADSQVALIKRADVRILKEGSFAEATLYRRLGISGNYDMEFDIDINRIRAGGFFSIALSQVLAPNTADRFTFTIGGRATTGVENGMGVVNVAPPAWYYFQFDLVYDEDNKIISSQPILIMLPPSARVDPIKANYNLINDLAKLKGTRSPSIDALITYFATYKADFADL